MSELKPCPFCGGEAEKAFGRVWCGSCFSEVTGIEEWNTRPSMHDHAEEMYEALEYFGFYLAYDIDYADSPFEAQVSNLLAKARGRYG